MALGAGDLVLCSGTLPREVPVRERVDAAVAGGFAGLSLWGRDYRSARRDGLEDPDIRALLVDNALEVAELDLAWWWLPGASDVHIPETLDTEELFAYDEAELFRIADAVGARSLNAIDVFGGDWTVAAAAAAFAGLCDRAAEHGLLVHVEFLPWSRIPDVGSAWEIVRRADRPNGGVLVDAWHYFRSGGDDAALRAVPGDRVLALQLDDGPVAPEPDLPAASLHDRVLPGAGEFDLRRLVRTLREIGAVAPIGVEVFSDELHALEPSSIGIEAGAALRRVLSPLSDWPPSGG
jgi:sugar phosphate isomerase/epimerase